MKWFGLGAKKSKMTWVSEPEADESLVMPDLPDARLLDGSRAFALRLLGALLEARRPDENLLVSPLGLELALSLTAQGARGRSREALEQLLGLPAELAAGAWPALRAGLQATGRADRIGITTGLWLGAGAQPAPAFAELARQGYGARVAGLDFSKRQARAELDAWVRRESGGRITRLSQYPEPRTRMLLLNVLSFSARWASSFERYMTQRELFHPGAGSPYRVQMMNKGGMLRYARLPGLGQLLMLAYRRCGVQPERSGASFYVLLPEPGLSRADLARQLNAANWARWLAALELQQVSLKLPRFSFGQSHSFNFLLTELGLGSLFGEAAELGGILAAPRGEPLWLDQVAQQCRIELDEKGTEAVALTEIHYAGFGGPPAGPESVCCDRPFLFLIGDAWSGSLLFAGLVARPEKA